MKIEAIDRILMDQAGLDLGQVWDKAEGTQGDHVFIIHQRLCLSRHLYSVYNQILAESEDSSISELVTHSIIDSVRISLKTKEENNKGNDKDI